MIFSTERDETSGMGLKLEAPLKIGDFQNLFEFALFDLTHFIGFTIPLKFFFYRVPIQSFP